MCVDKFIKDGVGLYSSDTSIPYRAFELTKFYELVKKNNHVVGIEIDVESKVFSFIVHPKQKEI
jgi:hypothetical protein